MLNARQKQFCVEYWQSKNVTQAAKNAGYSQKTAYSIGCELLKKPEIQEELKKYETQQMLRVNISKDDVVLKVKEIAESPDSAAKDKLRAYELICKMYGFTSDNIKVEGQIDTTVSKLDGILKQLGEK